MLVKKISFVPLNLLEESLDMENYNIDVFVELENGYIYTVGITIANSIMSLLDRIRRKQTFQN